MATLATVLLVWAVVLAVFVAALALGTRRRRGLDLEDTPERRAGRDDRRGGDGDRRIGLPDLRLDRIERRSTTGDRRGGMVDRRHTLGST